jgi:hypothetical protein
VDLVRALHRDHRVPDDLFARARPVRPRARRRAGRSGRLLRPDRAHPGRLRDRAGQRRAAVLARPARGCEAARRRRRSWAGIHTTCRSSGRFRSGSAARPLVGRGRPAPSMSARRRFSAVGVPGRPYTVGRRDERTRRSGPRCVRRPRTVGSGTA